MLSTYDVRFKHPFNWEHVTPQIVLWNECGGGGGKDWDEAGILSLIRKKIFSSKNFVEFSKMKLQKCVISDLLCLCNFFSKFSFKFLQNNFIPLLPSSPASPLLPRNDNRIDAIASMLILFPFWFMCAVNFPYGFRFTATVNIEEVFYYFETAIAFL